MKYVYPAIFYPENDGCYTVIFPDLNNLATEGESLEEAIEMAIDACSLYLFTSLKDKEAIPKPSKINEIQKEDETGFINLIYVDLSEFAAKHSDKSIKKTLSIPQWLNTVCETNNINFSKVLQEALIEKIQQV